MSDDSKTKKTEEKKTVKSKTSKEWEKMDVRSLKVELQKLTLDVRTGVEKNTSLLKKVRKIIAKKLTQNK